MKAQVLLVEDDRLISRMIADCLGEEGFLVLAAFDCGEATGLLGINVPDVILLDVELPDLNGLEFCRILRNDTRTGHVPIIMLTSRDSTADKVAGLEAGADDYVTKPFDKAELVARVKTQLRRAKQEKLFNPLTGLPGNKLILDRINLSLAREKDGLAVAYVDLDHFKAYNDYYGFVRGDDVLLLLADILQEKVRKLGNPGDFLGHIGGDDFIFITTPERVEAIGRSVMEAFSHSVLRLYDEADRERGYITTRDRQGRESRIPLITVSIAVVVGKAGAFSSSRDLAELAAKVKRRAKEIEGNAIVCDEMNPQALGGA